MSLAVDAAKRELDRTDFPAVDPFVAAVAQNVDAVINSSSEVKQSVRVWLPQHFDNTVDVKMGLDQGPHAKMLVILPGIGNDASVEEAAGVGLGYLAQIYQHGYEGFETSELAQRGDHRAERVLAYRAGPRAVLASLRGYLGLTAAESTTFNGYMRKALSRDPWFARNHTTVDEANRRIRFDRLLARIHASGIPTMVVMSCDDFILSPDNIATFAHEAGQPKDDQVVHQYSHGGHLGLLFNPQIRRTLGGVAAAPSTDPTGGTEALPTPC